MAVSIPCSDLRAIGPLATQSDVTASLITAFSSAWTSGYAKDRKDLQWDLVVSDSGI